MEGRKKLGHGIGYKYAHDYPENYVKQQYLPDEVKEEQFYIPTENGYENHIKEALKTFKRGSLKKNCYEKSKKNSSIVDSNLLIAMIFVTLYCAITGSPYFMASLFTMLALPLLIYAYMFIYRIVKDKNEKK